jgi:ribonuclease HII
MPLGSARGPKGESGIDGLLGAILFSPFTRFSLTMEKHSPTANLYEFDRSIELNQRVLIVGIDEAGRGPLAGPVVAAAVVLDLENIIPGINDSKKLPAAKRELLYAQLTASARAWGVGEASVEEIERHNILQATFLAMKRALAAIKEPWSLALVDGNQRIPGIGDGAEASRTQRTVVEGDAQSASIAAASILAKVTRDRIMQNYHERYPIYDFYSNKGYGTARHREAIEEHGMCEIHRRSFCTQLVLQTRLAL